MLSSLLLKGLGREEAAPSGFQQILPGCPDASYRGASRMLYLVAQVSAFRFEPSLDAGCPHGHVTCSVAALY